MLVKLGVEGFALLGRLIGSQRAFEKALKVWESAESLCGELEMKG